VLAACGTSAAEEPSADPWAEEWQRVGEEASSDYLREILDDGDVTAQEYAAASNRFVECVNQSFPHLVPPPFAADWDADGLVLQYGFEGPTEVVMDPGTDAIIEACSQEYQGEVALLYEAQRRNPERQDWRDVAVDCLVRAELVSGDYSVDNLMADLYWDNGGDGAPAHGAGQEPPSQDLVTEFDASSTEPDVLACIG